MKRRSLKEDVMAIQILPQMQVVDNTELALTNMIAEWSNIPYAELSIILAYLRYLSMVHQTHHWISKGDNYYGDHLLFERLYNTVSGEIDGIAEKSVGLGSEQNVNVNLQMSQMMKLLSSYGSLQMIPQSNELSKRSLNSEMQFVKIVDILCKSMKEQGTCTQGVENMLQGIIDTHETNIYLLKRRCTKSDLV
jgi:DNA-binding ferritin-like protein